MFDVKLTVEDLEILRGCTTNEKVIETIRQMDRENHWKETLTKLNIDVRVWPLVASIVEKQSVEFSLGSITFYGYDLMGYQQQEYKTGRKTSREGGVEINGFRMTYKGWEEAKLWVQQALDTLGTLFASTPRSGLVCTQGEHRMEEVYYDENGQEFRLFDMGHGTSGMAGSCRPVFRTADWLDICHMKKRSEMVKVEGWRTCDCCGKPIRPIELRKIS